MLRRLSTTFLKLPYICKLITERDHLQKSCGFVPPGHFYSPIPSLADIATDSDQIFSINSKEIPGVNLRENAQLELLNKFIGFYSEQPFTAHKNHENRYYFENPSYSYSDAILLHCMIRHLTPKRIVEVGSGYSSCVMLDTNDLFFDGQVKNTFIEPYPDLLLSLIKRDDKSKIRLIPDRVQHVDLGVFEELEKNDILFIDSTHVTKINSDVNRILFDILPRLKPGVYVHFHDVFFPFEYPKEWVFKGISWNEQYILRAFLQYNSQFRVVLMNTFMEHFHESFFDENMPLCLKNRGGSIWIEKL